MTRSDVFQSNYLGKTDLPGGPRIVTIQGLGMAEVKGARGNDRKAVLSFAEAGVKPMILNKMNWIIIEGAYGMETNGWVGKQIEIYVDPNVMFGVERVGGVRIRIPQHQSSTPMSRVEVWSFKQACEEAAKVGITEESVKANVKNRGGTGWKPDRDTAGIKAMIQEMSNPQREESFDQAPNEEIPFNWLLPFAIGAASMMLGA